MRPLLFAATALTLTVSAWAGDGIKVTKAPLKVGEVGTVDEALSMDIDLSISMGDSNQMSGKMVATREIQRTFEVREVGPAGPSQLRVTYRVATSNEEMFGNAKNTVMPVQGNTYVMTMDGEGQISAVTADDGAVVDSSVQSFLMGDNFLSTTSLSSTSTGSESIRVGQDITELANLASTMPKMDPKTGVLSATVTGSRKDEGTKVATVDLVIKGTFNEGPMRFGFDGAGEILVNQKRGFIHSMVMDAPITMSGGETNEEGLVMKMEGKGTMSMKINSRVQ